MATLAQLRREAKRIGISTAVIHAIKDPSGLQSVIDDAKAHDNGSETQTRSRRAVKKAVVRKKTTTAPRKKSHTSEDAPKRRGRPPGRKTAISKSASSKSLPAAKSKSGKAQRTTSATASTRAYTKKEREKSDGRYTLEGVDYTQTDGWNAREGSVPDRILKSLRKHKGDRQKVFIQLLPEIGKYVKPLKQNGQRRNKAEMQAMLKYRIARTDWDFALKTGQHKQSPNWGTGQYAKTNGHRRTSTVRKSKSAPVKKSAAKKAPARKAKTATRAKTAAKAAPKRKSAAPKAKTATRRASGGRTTARKAVPARKTGGRGRR